MSFIPKPKLPSIEEMGLRQYLDGSTDNHQGFGYDDFVKMYQSDLSKPAIAKAFGVRDKKTIYRWIKIYDKEVKLSKVNKETI